MKDDVFLEQLAMKQLESSPQLKDVIAYYKRMHSQDKPLVKFYKRLRGIIDNYVDEERRKGIVVGYESTWQWGGGKAYPRKGNANGPGERKRQTSRRQLQAAGMLHIHAYM